MAVTRAASRSHVTASNRASWPRPPLAWLSRAIDRSACSRRWSSRPSVDRAREQRRGSHVAGDGEEALPAAHGTSRAIEHDEAGGSRSHDDEGRLAGERHDLGAFQSELRQAQAYSRDRSAGELVRPHGHAPPYPIGGHEAMWRT